MSRNRGVPQKSAIFPRKSAVFPVISLNYKRGRGRLLVRLRMKDASPTEYNPHSNYTHSGFDDILVCAFVAHIPANEVHLLDEALESIDSLRVVHRQISEGHLYITEDDPRKERG
ncbi:hypothetical protein AKJ37_04030 [candidate division MSBL1 archaeon SCGC-AAA259I09]|uniref:Uncharacterized protein n=1 Tax=candidate division MSBL1 archaeon SCGC-AAA259I09 TaxID=1698267 RepID=A0A133US48_9EURY|nr:hypothetical protein AKJ37_04030 [candidate division MSBL1 archaeon SCGC-AAA259I09]